MGQEESTGRGKRPADDNEDDDVRYTSYSVPRPRKELTTQASTSSETADDIVVVSSDPAASKPRERDPALQQLEKTPTFFPLMRSSLNLAPSRDLGELDQLSDQQVLMLCLRYQRHLKECAACVGAEQDRLTGRVRDMEQLASAVFQTMVHRHQQINRIAPQLRAVEDMARLVQQIEKRVAKCVESAETLNSLLPPRERMEHITFPTANQNK